MSDNQDQDHDPREPDDRPGAPDKNREPNRAAQPERADQQQVRSDPNRRQHGPTASPKLAGQLEGVETSGGKQPRAADSQGGQQGAGQAGAASQDRQREDDRAGSRDQSGNKDR